MLGLAGVLIPTFLQNLVPLFGMVVLIPSLLLREEYRESPLPRILITAGAIAVLIPFLIPKNGNLPLVQLFKTIIDAPAFEVKLLGFIVVAFIVVVVLTWLAWLPSPASGGAKTFAWMLILWPAIEAPDRARLARSRPS